jgi:predicted dehydrogenase
MSRRTSRRQFIRDTTMAGIGFWVAGGLTPRESRAANEKLNIACIGVNGKGGSDSSQAGKFGNIVAICDVDSDFLDEKAKQFPQAKKFSDFREMLTKMEKEIDAVTVSTPDHTHAVASVMAMKMGKHVYCQKPLTHTVFEARTMRETAASMKVCTQMGNQGSAEDGLRKAVELVQAGAIGQVKEAHVWTNRPVWPQAPKITARPKGEEPIPKYLNWNCWLGPALDRPFHHGPVDPKNPKRGTYHDFNWRGWWDFGTGALGDMACHTANMAFRALKLGYPTTILAENGEINPETYPAWARVAFEFPARGEMVPVKFVWYEGHKDSKQVLPSPDLVKGQKEREKGYAVYFKDDKWFFFNSEEKDPRKQNKVITSGSFLVGDKAVLFSPDDYGADSYLVTPDSVEKIKGKPEKMPSNAKGDSGMKEEWIQAIKENKPTIAYSNFDFAAMLTETILLGNVAMRVGKKLEWDGPNLKVTNTKDAEKFIKTEYRAGWKL